ncbi:MAG: response regulator [Candidatus Acidiferrum sp.]
MFHTNSHLSIPGALFAMNHPTILVVEDDQPIRHMLRNALSNSGFEVLDEKNIQQAIATLRRERLDLILLDLDISRDIDVCSRSALCSAARSSR